MIEYVVLLSCMIIAVIVLVVIVVSAKTKGTSSPGSAGTDTGTGAGTGAGGGSAAAEIESGPAGSCGSLTTPTNSGSHKCPAGWAPANGTVYDSWPKPGSKECDAYSGCRWAGTFKKWDPGDKTHCKNGAKVMDGGSGQKTCRIPPELVAKLHFGSTHDKQWNVIGGKQVELMIEGKPGKTVRVNMLDVCADSDCSGCCTQNTAGGKFTLIDIEKNPASKLLGFSFSQSNFDINNVKFPTNPRAGLDKKVKDATMPLCYKVVGCAPKSK
jgi:hypothetical protein